MLVIKKYTHHPLLHKVTEHTKMWVPYLEIASFLPPIIHYNFESPYLGWLVVLKFAIKNSE